jgi:hypothetical protein
MKNISALCLYAVSALLITLGLATWIGHSKFGEGPLTVENGWIVLAVGVAAFMLAGLFARQVKESEPLADQIQRKSKVVSPLSMSITNAFDFHAPIDLDDRVLLIFKDVDGGFVANISESGYFDSLLVRVITLQSRKFNGYSAEGSLLFSAIRSFSIWRKKTDIYSSSGDLLARSQTSVVLGGERVQVIDPCKQILLTIHSPIFNPLRHVFFDSSGNEIALLTKNAKDVYKSLTRGTLAWNLELVPDLDSNIRLIVMAMSTFAVYQDL